VAPSVAPSAPLCCTPARPPRCSPPRGVGWEGHEGHPRRARRERGTPRRGSAFPSTASPRSSKLPVWRQTVGSRSTAPTWRRATTESTPSVASRAHRQRRRACSRNLPPRWWRPTSPRGFTARRHRPRGRVRATATSSSAAAQSARSRRTSSAVRRRARVLPAVAATHSRQGRVRRTPTRALVRPHSVNAFVA
jgi:hypothetical protein